MALKAWRKRYGQIVMLSMLLVLAVILAGCGSQQPKEEGKVTEQQTSDRQPVEEKSVTVYSGRSEELVGPLFKRFEEKTGIKVQVRYGKTAELAATILEEGENSPADVFLAQDAGALGAVAQQGLFAELPAGILERVEPRFRSPEGEWVGISGRARVVVYNTDKLEEKDLPDSILEFTDPKWKGRIGWAPTNGSFQAFVTAMRVSLGEEATREWLKGILANEPRVYPKNTPIVEAVGKGEIDVGFVNHYYLFRLKKEYGDEFPAKNYYLKGGDPGALINVAGAGILKSSKQKDLAEKLITYLLSDEAQQYFADETYEYPLVEGIKIHPDLVPLSEIETPDIDLGDLSDLENTLKLLQETGVLD
ncbi:iron ABC transporter substrate-binding protein [Calderihabitans maritimus]|uniref:Extracellular solute-binding protein n=1 Tax=Calderihabitans maritimus TaxID=1246530 RepID=A0A1Z5HNV6_9FIRM|nr:iron ABC transporter substrate-binding protein [Calderihabitans maritimus]GAW91001.1 extracellular solute-binding protein [Calderihabitans maritimus]